MSDLNETKDAEDQNVDITTKDTEVVSDAIGSKDAETQVDTTKDGETGDLNNKDAEDQNVDLATKDGEVVVEALSNKDGELSSTKDIGDPESEFKDPESDKDGESGDLNDKDGETQEQIFQKDAEMSDIASRSKDTETETKDPEGDGAKDGESDLLNLFKGAGVGVMASVPRTVTPFEPLTQRDIRIQAPTMLSDIIRQQDAVAQLNQALAQAMSMPHGDKPSGRALNSLFGSLLNEKAV